MTNLLLAAATGGALGAVACGGGRLLQRLDRARHVPLPAWQLLALGALGWLGAIVCGVGFAAVPLPAYTEALAPQPRLAAAYALLAAVGASSVLAGRGPTRRAGIGATEVAVGIDDGGAAPRSRGSWSLRGSGSLRGCWLPQRLVDALLLGLAGWTLLPPHLVDETAYHLALPLHYLLAGRWAPIPGHGNNGFPALGEMAGFWPLACGSVAGARCVQLWGWALGSRAAVALWPARGRVGAAWGCLLFTLVPSVLRILPTSHVDVLVAAYAGVGTLCLQRFVAAPRPQPAPLWAAAAALGCAAACKVLALALWPAAALAALLALRRWQTAGVALPRARTWAVAAMWLVLPGLPFAARSAWLYGNPLFPFALELFPRSAAALWPAQRETLAAFMRQFGPVDAAGQPLWGLAALRRLPGDLLFAARFDSIIFDGVIGPLPAVALLACLSRRGRAAVPRLVGGLTLLTAAVWLSTSWQARFALLPLWGACLALPGTIAATRPRAARAGLAALAVVATLLPLGQLRARLPAWDRRMFGDAAALHALRLTRSPRSAVCDALAAAMATPEGGTALRAPSSSTAAGPATRGEPAAGALVGSASALMVWTQREALWCGAVGRADSYHEAATLDAWLAAGDVAPQMRAAGLTHLVLHEADTFEVPPGAAAAERAQLALLAARLRTFLATECTLQARAGGVALYALRAPAAAEPARVARAPE